MCSSIKMARQSSATWTSPRSRKEASSTRRLERHIMRVLRCGATSPTIWKAISGHSAACCTSRSRSGPPLEQMIWQASTAKCSEVCIQGSLNTFRKILVKLQNNWFKWMHHLDQAVIRFSRCLLSSIWVNSSSWMISMIMMTTHRLRVSCWARSECLRIFSISPTDCQSLSTMGTLSLGIEVKMKNLSESPMIKINYPISNARSKEETTASRQCLYAALVMKK